MRLDDIVFAIIAGIPRHKRKVLCCLALSLVSLYVANRHIIQKASGDVQSRQFKRIPHRTAANVRKVGVNAEFFSQLRRILPICVPGISSRECGMLFGLAGILVARSWLDIWFASFNGIVVRSIVSRDWNLFVKNALILFSVMMWPMSIINNSLKFTINNLALAFRSRLTHHVHQEYLKGITFYQIANLDNRIQNVDQLITQDIDKFGDTLSRLCSDIAKPVVDIGLFAYKLGQSIGLEAPLMMLAYFTSSGVFLRYISPPFGRYVAIEQGLEGDFRYAHSRIIAHSEEIAFYNGSGKELAVINSSLRRIIDRMRRTFWMRFGNGILESVLVKYCATQLAYYILSRPVFGTKESSREATDMDPTKIMENYSRHSGYLINLSHAVGRIVLAGRELTRFAGYTSRIAELINVLDNINTGQYQRTMPGKDNSGISETKTINQKALTGKLIIKDGEISFNKVPITTPNGDVLVPNMSFKMKPGMSCIVTGPNGCGKSSLFRILGSLWPLFSGTLIRPCSSNMFYVPQKPYMTLGTLRDQVIYPDDVKIMAGRGHCDADLMGILKKVRLEYLVEREGGWDATSDWFEVLSGGEKQRIAMARLFYHCPQFAILDECTSAVSIDVEGAMYQHAKELGITLFTVSHRSSLFPYHEYMLHFDGHGGYEFGLLDGSKMAPSISSMLSRSSNAAAMSHADDDGDEGDEGKGQSGSFGTLKQQPRGATFGLSPAGTTAAATMMGEEECECDDESLSRSGADFRSHNSSTSSTVSNNGNHAACRVATSPSAMGIPSVSLSDNPERIAGRSIDMTTIVEVVSDNGNNMMNSQSRHLLNDSSSNLSDE